MRLYKLPGCFTLLHYLDTLLSHYGYGVIGVVVMLESMGLPLPAESLLITASLLSATTHKLSIWGIVIAGVSGAIMGDNFGYLIGKEFGFRFLHRYGKYVGLSADRILLGRYIFRQHGGTVVFFGRFIALLRIFVALLAGANRMPWHTFLLHNALGGLCWAGGYTLGAYYLGHEAMKLSGPVAWGIAGLAALVGVTVFLFLKKNEKRLIAQAMKAAKNDRELTFGMEKELTHDGEQQNDA
ncbi:DedA family protein [Acetobacter sp.]|jgi:membrane protein DedA with SNARE-associated domain|uniref:DedA family protein n=1 Tax=Acetobacter sp. TaxID=440 RepID=UPI0025BC0ADD|nr:DedA family protein [Acetobacter sp.]MCH4091594.1 DedA family protein [Acetobacter sp.]MCI1301158.1 DedA family protein [Acetobacter sp.]MCI1317438.1 DedA family protein [Acetobacter sp.]